MAFDPTKRGTKPIKKTPRRSKYSDPSDDAAAAVTSESEVSPTLPAASAARTPARRGNPDYSQVSAQIPKDLHKRFKAKVTLEEDDEDITSVLERLIRDYVEAD
jgi:hypothetical protein